jgi:hypothetical protein
VVATGARQGWAAGPNAHLLRRDLPSRREPDLAARRGLAVITLA